MKIVLIVIYKDYTSENFTSDYCLITYEYKYYWGWNYMTVNLNSDLLDINEVKIRPELGVIILNINYNDYFKKKFFEEKIKEGKCKEVYMMFSYYYCDKNVNIDIGELSFEIKRKGLKFSLNSKDLFMEYNNKKYFLVLFDIHVDKKYAQLGYPFLKKYDLIFNLDNRQFGFYNFKIKYEYKRDNKNENNNNSKEKSDKDNINNNDNNKISEDKKSNNIKNTQNESFDSKKLILILLIIFFIILVIYFVFTLFRKYERKRKGKKFEELFL